MSTLLIYTFIFWESDWKSSLHRQNQRILNERRISSKFKYLSELSVKRKENSYEILISRDFHMKISSRWFHVKFVWKIPCAKIVSHEFYTWRTCLCIIVSLIAGHIFFVLYNLFFLNSSWILTHLFIIFGWRCWSWYRYHFQIEM